MSKIKMEIAVDATPEKVWDVLGDFGNVYKWSPAVISSSALSGHERGGDAIRQCEVPGFGTVDETVTDWTEGQGFRFEVEATGPIKRGISEWRIQDRDGETFVSVAFDFHVRFGAIGSVMDRLVMRRMIRRLLSRTLTGLKYYVETGEEVGDRLPEGVGTENVQKAIGPVAA